MKKRLGAIEAQILSNSGTPATDENLTAEIPTKITNLETKFVSLEQKNKGDTSQNFARNSVPQQTSSSASSTDANHNTTPQIQEIIREELEEKRQIEVRKMNLIISNIPEDEQTTQETDKQTCKQLFQHLGVETRITTNYSLGKKATGKKQKY